LALKLLRRPLILYTISMERQLIVTHHAPDLDAITASWLLKRFDSQHYADAKFGFVNPGETMTEQEANQLGFSLNQITHVDTGLGKFDHHQSDKALQFASAASLVYDHICEIHPELKSDNALKELVTYVTDVDHFQEVNWPEADHPRYNFMIQEVIRGLEFVEQRDDQALLHFGFTCLDGAYSALKYHLGAIQIINERGVPFDLTQGKCLAIETRNDDTIKLAQKQGYDLVIRKDPERHHVRIKARPDSSFDLKPLHEKILEHDTKGTWYFHPSGKMLINGSRKHHQQTPTPLTLDKVVSLIKEVYGSTT